MACLCSLTVRSPCCCLFLFCAVFFFEGLVPSFSTKVLVGGNPWPGNIGGTPSRRGSRRWVHRGVPSRRHDTLANRGERGRIAIYDRFDRCLPGVRFPRSCSESTKSTPLFPVWPDGIRSFAIPVTIRWWCGLILPVALITQCHRI